MSVVEKYLQHLLNLFKNEKYLDIAKTELHFAEAPPAETFPQIIKKLADRSKSYTALIELLLAKRENWFMISENEAVLVKPRSDWGGNSALICLSLVKSNTGNWKLVSMTPTVPKDIVDEQIK